LFSFPIEDQTTGNLPNRLKDDGVDDEYASIYLYNQIVRSNQQETPVENVRLTQP